MDKKILTFTISALLLSAGIGICFAADTTNDTQSMLARSYQNNRYDRGYSRRNNDNIVDRVKDRLGIGDNNRSYRNNNRRSNRNSYNDRQSRYNRRSYR